MTPLSTSDFFSKLQNKELKFQQSTLNSHPFFTQFTLADLHGANSTAYTNATTQLTKLKAALKIYGYQTSTNVGSVIRETPTTQVNDTVASASIPTTLFEVSVAGMNLAINTVITLVGTLQGTSPVSGSATVSTAFKTIITILQWIEKNSTNNLNFATNTSIVTSLAKMSVAVISALSIARLESYVSTATTASATVSTSDAQSLDNMLHASILQGQLLITVSTVLNNIINNIVTQNTTQIATLQGDIQDPSYTLTAADQTLITQLKNQSLAVAALGLVIKSLSALYPSSAGATTTAPLFSSDVSSADAALTSFLSGDSTIATFLSTELQSIFGNDTTLTPLINTFTPQSAITPSTTDTTLMSTISQLALTPSNLVGTLINDAYTFAMTGMNYGYLFASQGESVGVMADRILFMSVQIGVMADRIGMMADRIVYTEQLIVYTEMLIQNFGLMMYGGMKQISDTMLTALAIIFNRQWYSTNTSTDPIVTSISNTTTQMLANMQQYELAVLANQNTLEQTTLSALNWISASY